MEKCFYLFSVCTRWNEHLGGLTGPSKPIAVNIVNYIKLLTFLSV